MQLFENVEVVTLPNGIRVISDYAPQCFGFAANIRIGTGNHHDRGDKMGLAHLGEHLTAVGMPNITMPAFEDAMAEFGMTIKGGHFNYETGPDYTDCWAEGSEEGVEFYLHHLASAIRERAYTQENFLIEQGRVKNETRNYRNDPDMITEQHLNQGLFHNGALARWAYGGLPDHVAEMTIQDVQEYHAHTHTSDNMIVFTSGSWSHERVQNWVMDNFGDLPRGKAFKKVKSPFRPQEIRCPAPWLSGETNFFFGANLGGNQTFNIADWNILRRALNVQFKALGNLLHVYGFGIALGGSNPDTSQCIVSSTPLEPAQVRQVVEMSAELLANAHRTVTPEIFEQEKRRFIAAEKLAMDFDRKNLRVRLPSLRSGNYFYDNPVYLNNSMHRMEIASYDRVMDLLQRIRNSKIATGYIGEQRDDFPTADEIQKILGKDNRKRAPARGLILG